MIRPLLGLRLNPEPDPVRSLGDALLGAAKAGARAVILEASGDLAPTRLGETGRRDLRHRLRAREIGLTALAYPTRRGFDSEDDLEARLARADRTFAMAYELGTRLVVADLGTLPGTSETEAGRLARFESALSTLGGLADRRGVTLAAEIGGDDPGAWSGLLDRLGLPTLGASLDPSAVLAEGRDPAESAVALGERLAHLDVPDPSAGGPRRGGRSRSVDWAAVLAALAEVGYRGGLTVRPGRNRDPFEAFRDAARAFEMSGTA